MGAPPRSSPSGASRSWSCSTRRPHCGPCPRTTSVPTRRANPQGLFARVRVEDYGPGRIRPHERTHPGPRRTASGSRGPPGPTSPPSSRCSPTRPAPSRSALAARRRCGVGADTDDDGTVNRLGRVDDPAAIAAVQEAVAGTELLIADGHHRYETARVYAEEIGGEGPHRYVLMCLVALQDPGPDRVPHPPARARACAPTSTRRWPTPCGATSTSNRWTTGRPGPALRRHDPDRLHRLALQAAVHAHPADPAIADAALPDRAEPYRRLDTAVLEALILKGALGMTDDDIDHLDGLGYARDFDQALELVQAPSTTPPSSWRRPRWSGSRRWPPPARACRPSPPTSSPRFRPGLLFNPLV